MVSDRTLPSASITHQWGVHAHWGLSYSYSFWHLLTLDAKWQLCCIADPVDLLTLSRSSSNTTTASSVAKDAKYWQLDWKLHFAAWVGALPGWYTLMNFPWLFFEVCWWVPVMMWGSCSELMLDCLQGLPWAIHHQLHIQILHCRQLPTKDRKFPESPNSCFLVDESAGLMQKHQKRACISRHLLCCAVWISGLAQTGLYADFFYYYFKSWQNNEKLSLPQ